MNLADVKNELLRFKQFQEASPEEQATEGKVSTHIARLRSSDFMVRERAASALGKLGKEAVPAIPALIELYKSKYSEDHIIATSVLMDLGPDVIPPMLELVKDKDPRVRLTGIRALEKVQRHDPAAIAGAWIEALNDTDARVRAAAARELGPSAKSRGVKVQETISGLTAALMDPDEDVRSNAAWSLWWMGEARVARSVLAELVHSKNPNTRNFAERALKDSN